MPDIRQLSNEDLSALILEAGHRSSAISAEIRCSPAAPWEWRKRAYGARRVAELFRRGAIDESKRRKGTSFNRRFKSALWGLLSERYGEEVATELYQEAAQRAGT